MTADADTLSGNQTIRSLIPGWVVTGMDWTTGATRQRVVFGTNNRGNGEYAVIQYRQLNLFRVPYLEFGILM